MSHPSEHNPASGDIIGEGIRGVHRATVG